MSAHRTFNRDTNARKALMVGLAKNLIEREQIKTTLPKAKDLRGVVEKLITRARVDSVANRRLVAAELGNGCDSIVRKLFTVLGPRYAKRPGGYTRVLKAGFRYGDAAPMAIIELVDRDVNAKKTVKNTETTSENSTEDVVKAKKTTSVKVEKEDNVAVKTAKAKTNTTKQVAVKRRATGK